MPNVSTNLVSALLNNESIDEGFRVEFGNAVNDQFSTEPQLSVITRNMILSEFFCGDTASPADRKPLVRVYSRNAEQSDMLDSHM